MNEKERQLSERYTTARLRYKVRTVVEVLTVLLAALKYLKLASKECGHYLLYAIIINTARPI